MEASKITLIEAEALADHLQASDWTIVDARSEAQFAEGHIPGAIQVAPQEMISGEKPAVGKLPSAARLQQLANKIGLDPDKWVIAYDAEGGGWAGRLIWTLEVLGHQKCAYLNGGWPAWQAMGLPEARGLASRLDSGPQKEAANVQVDSKYMIDFKELLQNHEALTIWDARSKEEYSGERILAAKGGHIPGAIHLDWLDLIDRSNHLKLKANLPELLAEKGLHRDADIVTHCQTHHRSGLTYLLARLLEYPHIRAYAGSWGEWGNSANAPVAQGSGEDKKNTDG